MLNMAKFGLKNAAVMTHAHETKAAEYHHGPANTQVARASLFTKIAQEAEANGDLVLAGPESHLEEILIVAYETALEAGLEPGKALCVIASWLTSQQRSFEKPINAS
jgi:hypothetical protein